MFCTQVNGSFITLATLNMSSADYLNFDTSYFCHVVRDKRFTKRQNLALKAFADDKFCVAKMVISVFDRVENIVGRGENAGHQHFLLFTQCFPKASYTGLLKVVILW